MAWYQKSQQSFPFYPIHVSKALVHYTQFTITGCYKCYKPSKYRWFIIALLRFYLSPLCCYYFPVYPMTLLYFYFQAFASSGEQSILLEWCGDMAHVYWHGYHWAAVHWLSFGSPGGEDRLVSSDSSVGLTSVLKAFRSSQVRGGSICSPYGQRHAWGNVDQCSISGWW